MDEKILFPSREEIFVKDKKIFNIWLNTAEDLFYNSDLDCRNWNRGRVKTIKIKGLGDLDQPAQF